MRNFLSVSYKKKWLTNLLNVYQASGNIRLVDSRPGQSPYDERDQVVVIICSLVGWMWTGCTSLKGRRWVNLPLAGQQQEILQTYHQQTCQAIALPAAQKMSDQVTVPKFSKLNNDEAGFVTFPTPAGRASATSSEENISFAGTWSPEMV